MIRIETKILKALLKAAGKSDIRFYLNGIMVDEKCIVATDGHRMHAIKHNQEWEHGQVIIPRAAVELAVKEKTKEVKITPNQIGSISFTKLEGIFPDYMRIIAPGTTAESGEMYLNVNPGYLADASEFIQSYKGSKVNYCLASVNGTFVWRDSKICVIVMPTRVKVGDTPLWSLDTF